MFQVVNLLLITKTDCLCNSVISKKPLDCQNEFRNRSHNPIYKFSLKETKLSLILLTVQFLNLGHNNSVVYSKMKKRTVNDFKTNLDFLRLNFFYRIDSRRG